MISNHHSLLILLVLFSPFVSAKTAQPRDNIMIAPIIFQQESIPKTQRNTYQVQMIVHNSTAFSDTNPPLLVNKKRLMSHQDIKNATVGTDDITGLFTVLIELTPTGSQRLHQVTSEYRGKQLAIIDGQSQTILTAPFVYEPIKSNQVSISSFNNLADAQAAKQQILKHGEIHAVASQPEKDSILMSFRKSSIQANEPSSVWRHQACTFSAKDFSKLEWTEISGEEWLKMSMPTLLRNWQQLSELEKANIVNLAREPMQILRFHLNKYGRQKYDSPRCLQADIGKFSLLYGMPSQLTLDNLNSDDYSFYLYNSSPTEMAKWWQSLTQ